MSCKNQNNMEKEQIPQEQANEIGISPQESPIEFLLSHMWTTDWVNYTRDQKLAVIDKAKKMEEERNNVKINTAIKVFENLKSKANSLHDVMYLNGVLAVLDSIKNETYQDGKK